MRRAGIKDVYSSEWQSAVRPVLETHPPSCFIYSEPLNRCLFGINALEIKLQNNEMAVCCLVIYVPKITESIWALSNQYKLLSVSALASCEVSALKQIISELFHISLLTVTVCA